jgi:heme exporter protein D
MLLVAILVKEIILIIIFLVFAFIFLLPIWFLFTKVLKPQKTLYEFLTKENFLKFIKYEFRLWLSVVLHLIVIFLLCMVGALFIQFYLPNALKELVVIL